MDKKEQTKTAQPFADDAKEKTYPGVRDGEFKPRPDQLDDIDEKRQESDKVTQRHE